jgi:Domian of unknown function (DUF4952)
MLIQLLRHLPIALYLTLSWQIYTVKLADAPLLCENFLTQWGKKPKQLTFVGCNYEKNVQSDRSIAKYTVKGTEATIIESFLRQNFQMAPLKFRCCGWEPVTVPGSDRRYGTYRDRSGYYYEISMGSEETVEKNWDKISIFYVSVTKFMSDI